MKKEKEIPTLTKVIFAAALIFFAALLAMTIFENKNNYKPILKNQTNEKK